MKAKRSRDLRWNDGRVVFVRAGKATISTAWRWSMGSSPLGVDYSDRLRPGVAVIAFFSSDGSALSGFGAKPSGDGEPSILVGKGHR